MKHPAISSDYHGPMTLITNPKRLAELQAMLRCTVCRSLVKVCGGCERYGSNEAFEAELASRRTLNEALRRKVTEAR